MSSGSSLEKVKKLREITGVGFKDCKNAIDENKGDIEKSIEYLRKKGIAKANKKMERVAADGLVCVSESENKNSLDCIIDLKKQKKMYYRIEAEGTNSSGNYGTSLNLKFGNKNIFRGDENFSWIETQNKQVLVKSKNSGFFEFAIIEEDEERRMKLVPSGVPVIKRGQSGLRVAPGIPNVTREQLGKMWQSNIDDKRNIKLIPAKNSP